MSLPEVLEEMRRAEREAGRAEGSARLVAVTKGHSLEEIVRSVLSHSALQPGGFPLAENRGQELRDKVAASVTAWTAPEWPTPEWPTPEWHFIGPVQRNKVKYLGAVTLIHTIEELSQAEAVAAAAEGWGRAPAALLQVHNGEAQKHGVLPAELPELLRGVRQTGLEVRGLMVMAPYGQPEAAGALFAETRQRAHDLGLGELSMGMSDDFEAAIAQGATLVRVGRRLFGGTASEEETHETGE
ncbi:MAG: YggS family pyridoxal phosphate enzyme [Deinococcus sp.]